MQNTTSIIMGIQIFALVVLFVNLVFVINRKSSEMQNYLIILLIATILMFVGYIIEIQADSLEGAEIGAATAYLGKPFIMLYSFMFINSFYEFKINKIVFYVLNLICASYFFLVYTNPIHHLYYGETGFDASRPFSPLITSHGKFYFTYIVCAVAFFVACLVTIIRGYLKNKTKENFKISFFMSLMIVSGIGGYVTYLSNIIEGYDTTLLGILGSTICLSIMFYKYQIFDVLSYAKNEALKDSSTGLIVLNQSNNVIYKNQVGEALISQIGLDKLKDVSVNGENIIVNDKTYYVKSRFIDSRGKNYGKSIEIADITVSHNYQTMLERDVKARTEKIENIQRQLIGSFASVVEARSLETGEHIIRTSEYVKNTAIALRNKGLYKDLLTDEYINLLANAAVLHDIGKIAVSDTILNKPGRLNDEEYNLMKIHANEGAKIIEKTLRGLEDDEYVDLAVEVALYHHEWYNGHGYPSGLIGDKIPLSARIMALADTYDALVSERCYKKPMAKQQAIEIIKQESEKHFDPEIAQVFISVINA